jgi:outer membrane protein OmpA-like peptidoglycan-associated protein
MAAIILRESRDIGIHGHSDRTGSAEKNLDLSLRRAVAVENILLQHGINRGYLEVRSHGEGNPLVPTADGVDEPRNRRVEVVVR